jgi:HlyD family secretion protein
MKRRTLLAVLSVAVLAALVFWALKSGRGPIAVSVAEVTVQDISAPFTAEGVVKGETVEVEPEISGRIVAISVREGASVKEGEALVRLSSTELERAVSQAQALRRAAGERVEEARHNYDLTRRRVEAAIREADAAHSLAVARMNAVLAGPRPEEVAQAEQRLRQAETAEAQAKVERDRAQRLFDQGALPQADLQRAIATHDAAMAESRIARESLDLLKKGATEEDRRAARAQVELARTALDSARANREQVDVAEHGLSVARASLDQATEALRSAEAAMSKATIRAPFAGTVSYIPVKVGDLAAPGRPLLTLVGEGPVTVEAEIGDQDFAKVSVGQEVEVSSASRPGAAIRGTVARIASEAVQKPGTALRTRILRATVHIQDEGQTLRPGMEVDVQGTGVVATSALTIPSAALIAEGEEQRVWVVSDGKVTRRSVKVGAYTFERVQVLDGLKAGEKVVVSAPDALTEGESVTTEGA